MLAALIPGAVYAAAPVPPGAGSILQQLPPAEPPTTPGNNPGLVIEPQAQPALPPTAPFPVKRILITGNAAFDAATLHALVAVGEGRDQTLAQLEELAGRITDFYHRHGYPLARAVIPAQTIEDGAVRFEVIEVRYGKVHIDNRAPVKDSLLQSTLASVESGQPIEQGALNRSLLLLSDIPGVVSNATLRPGEAPGTSDLVVETTSGARVAGNVGLDDYGSRYNGRERASGSVSFFDPLQHGDYLSLNGLSSGRDMDYARLAYDTLGSGAGTHVGGSYSALHYDLGGTLSSLEGHGTAEVSSLWLRQPLLRSVDNNLYGQVQFDHKQLRDHIDVQSLKTDRHMDNWTASLAGDGHDQRLSGGVSSWSFAWTSGRVGFDNAAAQSVDARSARTDGRFEKLVGSFTRLQSLQGGDALYVSVSGQWANVNLDEAEKMAVGGPYSVRAYDMGTLSADLGYLLTAEWRHDLGHAGIGQWQGVAFADRAHVTVNKDPWASGANGASLGGAGVGLNLTAATRWNARVYVARRVGATPVLAGASSALHAWIEVGRAF